MTDANLANDRMTTDQIARVAYAALREYGDVLGQDVEAPWDEAPGYVRSEMVGQVQRIRDGQSPRDIHDAWVAAKLADGWTRGPVTDTGAREHPNLCPYEELPLDGRRGNAVLEMIVDALSPRAATATSRVVIGEHHVIEVPGRAPADGEPQQIRQWRPPVVGETVHYVSHGSPVLPDGSQRYTSECRAAIVTQVPALTSEQPNDGTTVGLCVLNPTGQFFSPEIGHAHGTATAERTGLRGIGLPAITCGELEYPGGTWHWPQA